MSVILLILKIIGIVLLALLGIILAVVCLVLFVPIRYRVSGEIEDEQVVHVKVTWLLHLISWSGDYEGEEFHSCLRIFGIRKKSKPTLSDLEEETAEMDEEDEDEPDVTMDMKDEPDATMDMKDEPDVAAEPDVKEYMPEIKPADEASRQSKRPNPFSKIFGFFQKIKQKCIAMKQAIPRIKAKILQIKAQAHKIKTQISDIKDMLMDENNKIAFASVWEELKYLLMHFKFRRIDTELSFALGDPATTGQALGVLAMMPFLYQYNFHIYSDFEADESYVRGTFFIKGRVRLVHLLRSIVRLLRKKEIRLLLNKFMNSKNKK